MSNDLSDELDKQLSVLTGFMANTDDAAVAVVARGEIPHLVDAVRALLEEHQLDEKGRCRVCRVRWRLPGRRVTTPCRAYLAAHLCLSGAAAATAEERRSTQQSNAARLAA